jgi:hypothetical protein
MRLRMTWLILHLGNHVMSPARARGAQHGGGEAIRSHAARDVYGPARELRDEGLRHPARAVKDGRGVGPWARGQGRPRLRWPIHTQPPRGCVLIPRARNVLVFTGRLPILIF